jgi:signal transduction histidine kinase
LQERPGIPLTAVEEKLFNGLAAQAGLVLRLAGLRAELQIRHEELKGRADELKASRQRLIALQDAERRRLERDIHDGAQQHLVALAVNLRLAETIAARSPERAAQVLAAQVMAADVAIETLRSLSQGIYPGLLSKEGLVPALRSAVKSSPIPVEIQSEVMTRLPGHVEAAFYFCAMEAVQNAAKHSAATTVHVYLGLAPRGWELRISDDGQGFDVRLKRPLGAGAGLINMDDRLDAVGGTVTVASRPGAGAEVTAVVPCAPIDGRVG